MKKKLVILSPGFPANETDSTCVPAIQQFVLALQAQSADTEPVVIAFQYPFLPGSYNWYGVRVIALGGRNRGKLFRIFTWMKALRELTKLRRSGPLCGILSLWLGECALVGKYFARLRQLPHYTWLQGQDAKADNRYVKRVNPAPEQLIAISEFNCQELLRNHGLLPAQLIENGINPAIFPPFNAADREIDLLGAGSLIPLKRYDLFIETAARLCSDFPSLRCVIAGGGPEQGRLATMIREKGLEKNIRLAGELPHGEVLAQMNNSRIFLHTSAYEGNATAILEALYAGCLVVSTLSPGKEPVKNLYVCEDADLHAMLSRLLAADFVAESVSYHLMRDSARQMLKLFSQPYL